MSDAWIPVIFAAIIVLGVIGGQLIHMLFNRALPLLETLVQQKQKGLSGGDLSELRAEIASLETRIARLEGGDRRLEGLEEQVSFLQSLLEGRSEGEPAARDRGN